MRGARAFGAVLAAASLLPLHRLLVPSRAGPAGIATRSVAEAAWQSGLLGTVVVVVVAAALARLGEPTAARRAAAALAERALRVRDGLWYVGWGSVTLLLAAALAAGAFGGVPTSVDGMVQLAHARALAEGAPALPLPTPPQAWLVQNGLATDAGWASVYPPLHTALLALGLLVGAAWLVGPVMAGAATAAGLAALERALPDDRAALRLGAPLLAAGPFLLLLGGTHLSHTTAAALTSLLLLSALWSREGPPRRALLVGAVWGALVCARPWTGLTSGAALLLAAWWGREGTARHRARSAWVGAGGLPFAFLLLAWNRALYGHPLRLGYAAAYGPAHGLGFHRDPWGNLYGLREALAYTGADLQLLGSSLLESPVPATLLIAAALLLRPGGPGLRVPVAWIVGALLGNALYWHHGLHFGPRMLYETIPAWVALWALSARALVGSSGGPHPRFATRTGLWLVLLTLAGSAALLPGRLREAVRHAAPTAAARLPSVSAPALVFIHGSWASRAAAQLAAAGLRRDSVETALRRNALCRVHRASLRMVEAPAEARRSLDLVPAPGTPPSLRRLDAGAAGSVLVDSLPLPPACQRQLRADAFGTVDLEPFLWQAPPFANARVVVARDLGPALNAAVRRRYGAHRAWVLLPDAAGAMRLWPYARAMEALWAGAAGITPVAAGDAPRS